MIVIGRQNELLHHWCFGLIQVSSVLGGDLFIKTEGNGVGQVQVEMAYHVHDLAGELCRFNLTVTPEECFLDGRKTNSSDIRINLCVKSVSSVKSARNK